MLAVLSIGLLITVLGYGYASQPKLQGQLSLPGLSGAVDIVRDAEGIPHIYAPSEQDAWFALGFVHAQDRLWQMEINRRLSAGRMAEILGPAALGADRFLRTLGVRHNAEAIFANMASDTREVLQSYARGVNAYLAQRRGPLPPEFLILGAPPPEPWQPADSIAWQTMMAWDLGGNWRQELLRMRLAQRLSLQQINEFLPPYPGDPVMPTRDFTQLYEKLADLSEHMQSITALAPASHLEGKGSNAWSLTGPHTESGRPLLANDPHLGLTVPGLWYFAHLSAPGLELVGATIPGAPPVVLGHNTRIAWGFTNTAPDVQDLYIERVHPDNAMQYQTPEGWAEFARRSEIIKVKGEGEHSLEVLSSRHGPVISTVLPVIESARMDSSRYVLAFSWPALRADDMTLQATMRLNRAQNWPQFLAAARDFHAPQQNMHYADTEGNLGFVAPGRVPLRGKQHDLMGLAPAPGWEARYDWQGFIPFEALPQRYQPVSGRIVSANEKIVGQDYPYYLGSDWALPYRAERIHALLDEVPRHSVQSFAEIQADHVSLAARELLPLLRATVPASKRAEHTLALLSAWDGSMDADAVEPLLYNAWVRASSRLIFEDELGASLMQDYWELRNVYQPMLNVLKDVDGQSRWCGNSQLPASREGCAKLLTESLEIALADLTQRYGSDMGSWKWGHAHAAHSEHRPFTRQTLLAWLFDIRVASPGDTYTINVGRHSLANGSAPFANRHAASLRAIYDLSDLENSRFMHSTGQSGHVLSPRYRNFSQRWAEVEYFTIPTDRRRVEQGNLGTLMLRPSE